MNESLDLFVFFFWVTFLLTVENSLKVENFARESAWVLFFPFLWPEY